MTEEKKDDLNEQHSFLSGHEDLLETLNDKKAEAEEQAEKVESAEETPEDAPPEAVEEEAPEAKEEPVAEPIEEPAPVAEQEVEAPIATPEPIKEPAKTENRPQSKQPAQTSRSNKLGGKKKKKKPQHTPVTAEAAEQRHQELLKKQALEQQEVKEVLVFIQKYAKPTAIAIAVICAVVLADKFFKAQRHKKEATADAALMQARSAEDLQAIVDDYASTSAGPLATMRLARERFNAGLIDEAETLYTQFNKKHGDHELAAQAELNLISCKEAKGQLGDAHLLYGEFVTKHEGSYMVPSAMLGKARCLEALGQLDEAQIAYEDIIVNFPEGTWSQIAEANLKVVLGKKQ